MPASLVGYAAIALANGRWLSGLAAPLVAWLLWRRHPRARFSAYVLLTAIAIRAAVESTWWTAAYAVAAIVVLQTPPALGAWPRLATGRTRAPAGPEEDDDRMTRP